MGLHLPWNLWLPAAAMGLILAFHALRPRRRRSTVSSLLLWERFHRELQASARWRKLLASLLLLCHLLTAAAIGASLARPWLLQGRLPGERVVVLDAGGSMQAADVTPSRFAAARAEAARFLRSGGEERVVVIAGGPVPRIVFEGASRERAAAALESIEVSGAPTDWQRVGELLRRPEAVSVGIVTDGAVDPGLFAAAAAGAPVEPERIIVGSPHPFNVGITHFTARPRGDAALASELYLSVENFGDEAVSIPVRIESERLLLYAGQWRLEPGERRQAVFPYVYSGPETIEARLEVTDHLALDNAAWLTAKEPKPTQVLLVGPGSRHLEEALRVIPGVVLSRRLLLPPADAAAEAERRHLIIFDRVRPPEGMGGNVLAIGVPQPPGEPPILSPEVLWWDRTHPLSRFVDWSGLQIDQAAPLPRGAGRALVESEHGPLLSVRSTAGGERIDVAFALDASNFPRLVSFPIFLSHVVERANPAGWQSVPPPLAAGVAHAIPVREGASLTGPGGEQAAGRDGEGRPVFVPEHPGLYTLWSPDGLAELFAVAPPGPAVSDIRPRIAPSSPAASAAEERAAQAVSLAPSLLAAALLLLMAEGWLYAQWGRRRPAAGLGLGRPQDRWARQGGAA